VRGKNKRQNQLLWKMPPVAAKGQLARLNKIRGKGLVCWYGSCTITEKEKTGTREGFALRITTEYSSERLGFAGAYGREGGRRTDLKHTERY